MFETSSTYGTLGSGFTGSNSHSFSSSTSLSNSFFGTNTNSTTPISYRTSKSTYKTISSGGTSGTSMTAGGSFVNMHRNNAVGTIGGSTINTKQISYSIPFPGDDYDTPPTGELDDSFASPVGDVLLPLLLMAAAYAVVRWFKNWKRKRTRKRLFCIK